MRRIRTGIVAILTLLLSACSAADMREIELPSEEILLSRGRVVLVRAQYARIFDCPDSTTPVSAIVRRGEIGDILGSSAGQTIVRGELDYWYQVDFSLAKLKGWIFGGDLELYSTQAKAQSAAQNAAGEGAASGSGEASGEGAATPSQASTGTRAGQSN